MNEECITSQRQEGEAGYTSQSTKRTEDLSRDRVEIGHVDTSNGASVNVDAIDCAREVHPTTHNSGVSLKLVDSDESEIVEGDRDKTNISVGFDAPGSAREVHPTNSGVALKLVGSDEPKVVKRVARERHPITQDGGVASELAAPGLTTSGGHKIGSVIRNAYIVRGGHPIIQNGGVLPTSSDCRKTTVSSTGSTKSKDGTIN